MVRRLIFLIVILLSLGVGLFFGWVIKPGVQVGSPLSSLREDFRTDYVLMVAEVYNKDGDLTAAAARLGRAEQQGSHRGCFAELWLTPANPAIPSTTLTC